MIEKDRDARRQAGAILRRKRQAVGLRLEDVCGAYAERTGRKLCPGTVRLWEAEGRIPPPEVFADLAAILSPLLSPRPPVWQSELAAAYGFIPPEDAALLDAAHRLERYYGFPLAMLTRILADDEDDETRQALEDRRAEIELEEAREICRQDPPPLDLSPRGIDW